MNNINYGKSILLKNEFYTKYQKTIEDFEKYRKTVLPLCAAENIISEFSKSFVNSSFVFDVCSIFIKLSSSKASKVVSK